MHKFLKFIFWNKTLHVSDSSSVHHQEFFPVHTAMVYTVTVCTVKWWWTKELSETCSFIPKNKFEKLVHLVGFIIRIPYFIIFNFLSKSVFLLLFSPFIKWVNRLCPLHRALCSSVYIRILHAAGSTVIFTEKYVTLTNLYFA